MKKEVIILGVIAVGGAALLLKERTRVNRGGEDKIDEILHKIFHFGKEPEAEAKTGTPSVPSKSRPAGSAQDLMNGLAVFLNTLPSSGQRNDYAGTFAVFGKINGVDRGYTLNATSPMPSHGALKAYSEMLSQTVNDIANIASNRIHDAAQSAAFTARINSFRNMQQVVGYEKTANDVIRLYCDLMRQIIADTEGAFSGWVNSFDRYPETKAAPVSTDAHSPYYLLSQNDTGYGPVFRSKNRILNFDVKGIYVKGVQGAYNPGYFDYIISKMHDTRSVWPAMYLCLAELSARVKYALIERKNGVNDSAEINAARLWNYGTNPNPVQQGLGTQQPLIFEFWMLRSVLDEYAKNLAYLFTPENYAPKPDKSGSIFGAVLRAIGTAVPVFAPITGAVSLAMDLSASDKAGRDMDSISNYNNGLSAWASERGYA